MNLTDLTLAYRTRIVRIGNSKGVRIPKALLEESGMPQEIEISASDGVITIRAAGNPRAGWEESLSSNPSVDPPMIPDMGSTFDEEEWTWE